MPSKNLRVHELAKELGMTNAETVELAGVLGVPVKSHSSSLNEAYADMIRRRAVRDGLTRAHQPEEPKAVKKAAAKKAAKTETEPVAPEAPAPDTSDAIAEPSPVAAAAVMAETPSDVPPTDVSVPAAEPASAPVPPAIEPPSPPSPPCPPRSSRPWSRRGAGRRAGRSTCRRGRRNRRAFGDVSAGRTDRGGAAGV